MDDLTDQKAEKIIDDLVLDTSVWSAQLEKARKSLRINRVFYYLIIALGIGCITPFIFIEGVTDDKSVGRGLVHFAFLLLIAAVFVLMTMRSKAKNTLLSLMLQPLGFVYRENGTGIYEDLCRISRKVKRKKPTNADEFDEMLDFLPNDNSLIKSAKLVQKMKASDSSGQGRKSCFLLPKHIHFNREDGFLGIAKTPDDPNWCFRFEEIILEHKKWWERNEGTVFRGTIMHMVLPKPVATPVVLKADRRIFNWTHEIPGMEPLKLEDRRFEKFYEAFARDQVLGRRVLSPRFMEALNEAAKIYSFSRKPNVLIAGRHAFFIFPHRWRNRFEIVNLLGFLISETGMAKYKDQLSQQSKLRDILVEKAD